MYFSIAMFTGRVHALAPLTGTVIMGSPAPTDRPLSISSSSSRVKVASDPENLWSQETMHDRSMQACWSDPCVGIFPGRGKDF